MITTTAASPLIDEFVEPGTGKALPVRRGQILRIEQVVGAQCADFNAFSLNDYREHMHCGRIRTLHGLFPGEGTILWSAPPRDRPMMTLIADPVGKNDVNFPRCSGLIYESVAGLLGHSSCQDVMAESIREYGLTPDDVHDSFNFWVDAGVDERGRLFFRPNPAQQGDYVELLAHLDTLAVVTGCAGDIFPLSNYELKPLRVTVRDATSAEREKWQVSERPRYQTHQEVEDFRQPIIRVDRKLRRDPHYKPRWVDHPITCEEIAIGLSSAEYERLQDLRATDTYGQSDGEVLRHAWLSWWLETEGGSTFYYPD